MRLFNLHAAKLIWLGNKILVYPPQDFDLADVTREVESWEWKNNMEDIEIMRRMFGKRGTAAAQQLLARPWFTRRWIIQEVGLAQQATIHCGRASIDARRLIACAHVLCEVNRLEDSIASVLIRCTLAGLRDLHGHLRAGTIQNILLVEWIQAFQLSDCSDDRDKVYALMGLLSGPEGFLSTEAQHGSPALGYKSGVEHVYQALATHTLEKHQKTGLLCLLRAAAAFPSRDVPGSRIPSWIPDWRAAGRGWVISSCKSSTRLVGHSPLSGQPRSKQVDNKSLSIGGWKYSTITSKVSGLSEHPRPETSTSEAMIHETIWKWWQFYEDNMLNTERGESPAAGRPSVRGQYDPWRAFLDCATKNCCRTWGSAYEDAFEFLIPTQSSNRPGLKDVELPQSQMTSEAEKELIYNNLFLVMQRRSLFCDSWGRTVNCPDDTEVGDVVVLLPRGQRPWILRPAQGFRNSESKIFTFIGDAYVPEVMGRKIFVEKLGDPEWFTIQ
ncbi:hypothetical protein B0T16DRAFT_417644 [Cercophora newfieldiana]|uniref:Heterokaryon incompatibility domain-containing protein n=1 Tax=Cercophora newfieldiana TaxID=92897 RepID=A0AA39Y1R7_9PEZI|nr:hypothetical protein B0T16DRAFT_417644 [Cercophora newfieldiana]